LTKKRNRTTSVIFVEFTRGAELQKKMRDTLNRITPMLGYMVRVSKKGALHWSPYYPTKTYGVGMSVEGGHAGPVPKLIRKISYIRVNVPSATLLDPEKSRTSRAWRRGEVC
jgi:hypothetical protein